MITEIIWKKNSDFDYFNELLNLSIIYDAEVAMWELWLEDDLISIDSSLERLKEAALKYINSKAGEWISVSVDGNEHGAE